MNCLPTLNSFAAFSATTNTDILNQLIKDLTPAAQAAVAGANLTPAQKAAMLNVLPKQPGANNINWVYIGIGAAAVAAVYWFYLRKH